MYNVELCGGNGVGKMELFRHLRVRLGIGACIAALLFVLAFNAIRSDNTDADLAQTGDVTLNFDETAPSLEARGRITAQGDQSDSSEATNPDGSIVVNKRDEPTTTESTTPEPSDSGADSQPTVTKPATTEEPTTTKKKLATTPSTTKASPTTVKPTTTKASTTTAKPTTPPTTARPTTRPPTTRPPTTRPPVVTYDGTVNVSNADPEGDFGYRITQDFDTLSDNLDNHRRSTLRIFEDGVEIGPAHTLHADIRAKGRGRFSHWKSSLYLSATDNSDPRTNGRTYTYIRS